MESLEIGLIQTHLRIALRLAEQLQSAEEAQLILTHVDGVRDLLLALRPSGSSAGLAKSVESVSMAGKQPMPEATRRNVASAPVVGETPPPAAPVSATAVREERIPPVIAPAPPQPVEVAPIQPAVPPVRPSAPEPSVAPAPAPSSGGEQRAAAATCRGERLADTYVRRGVRNESFAQSGNLIEAKRSAIASVARALSVNDRLLFRNELFQGDNALFERALQQIDEAASLARALEIVHGCYQGPADNPVLQQFMQLLERRHNQ